MSERVKDDSKRIRKESDRWNTIRRGFVDNIVESLVKDLKINHYKLDLFKSLELDMQQLASDNSKYSTEDKIALVATYVATGSLSRAAKEVGIPRNAAALLKKHAIWWSPCVQYCQMRLQEELDGEITSAIHSMVYKIRSRISDSKNPVDIKTLTNTLNVLYNIRDKARGDPLSESQAPQGASDKEQLEVLRRDFYKLGDEIKAKMNLKVVSEQ